MANGKWRMANGAGQFAVMSLKGVGFDPSGDDGFDLGDVYTLLTIGGHS